MKNTHGSNEKIAGHPRKRKKEFFFKRNLVRTYNIYFIIVVFVLTITFFAPYSGSSNELERIMATQFYIIGGFGLCIPLRMGLDLVKHGELRTKYESKDLNGLFQTFVYFGIAFGLHALFYTPIFLFKLPLSVFGPEITLTMSVMVAIGEELFFSYFLLGIFAPWFKWYSIPIISGIFVLYHFYVYQSLIALLYVGIMRTVYSFVYLLSRRLSSVTLAHVLNNFLVTLRM